MTQQPFDLSSVPRDSRRVPIATKVSFKFERFAGFISEFSANISPTGMFITTKNPEPPGSILDFEFRLGDGFEIIQGKGEVVWTRAVAEGPHRPPGIGIRFLELSEGSKELIYRIVDQYIQDGGVPFDVSLRPPDPIPLAAAAPLPAAADPGDAPTPFPDLPDSGSLPPVDTSAWLPPLEPLSAGDADDNDFPPFMPPLPPMDEPEPPRPNLAFAGMAAGASARRSRVGPLVLAGLLLVLAVAAYLFRAPLLALAGLGGGDAEAAAAPEQGGAPPGSSSPPAAAAPPVIVEEAVGEGEPGAPLPEVVHRRVPELPAGDAAPPAAPMAGAPDGPVLTALERVTWEEAFGGTDVILWGNGVIRPEVYKQSRIGSPPRELIRLTGIARPFATPRVAVGTDEVEQVRVGYHEKAGGNELHVVIDLADPGVKVTRVEAREQHLRIHLQRP